MSLGLALSGGGFRATLFHLGVIGLLRDQQLLSRVTHISSVSGGSIVAAHMVLNWEKYVGTDEAFNLVVRELLDFVQTDIRGRIYRRLPGATLRRFIIPNVSFVQAWRQSATDLLKRYYSANLYHGASLASLRYSKKTNPDTPRPNLYLLTTNLTDGSQCSFQPEGFCNEERGHLVGAETFPLADAVAASSAFPGLFPPVVITSQVFGVPEAELGYPKILLTDGGVYDNLGVRKFHRLLETSRGDLEQILVSDASARFAWAGESGFLEPLKTSLRAGDILTKRIHDLEVDMARGSDFIRINITDVVPRGQDQFALFPNIQKQLPSIRTDLDAFTDLEIFTLITHGYCVARAALRKQGLIPDNAEHKPWDPTPESQEPNLKRLHQTRHLERVRKALSNSSRRKLRLISVSDRSSRVHLALIAVVLLTYFFGYSTWNYLSMPSRERHTKQEIENTIPRLERQYVDILSGRRESMNRSMIGYTSLPSDVAKVSVETWTTSQAGYALLKSTKLNVGDAQQIAGAINAKFDETTAEDWVKDEGGWHTRPGLKQFQAEPALYTAGALALLLRRGDLDQATKELLTRRYNETQEHLKKFDRYPMGTFNVFARQDNPNIYSIYTTTIGLMMLMEAKRTGLPWGNSIEQRDQSIRLITEWLLAKYDEEGSIAGWRGFDSPRTRNEVSEALTLQIFATLLDVEQEMQIPLPAWTYRNLEARLLTYASKNGPDSTGRTFIDVVDQKGKKEHNESSIAFLWRPWAIKCARLWLKRLDPSVISEKRVALREMLHRLVVAEGAQVVSRNQNDYTFVSSEMLIALSP